jgi:hypothetical protein
MACDDCDKTARIAAADRHLITALEKALKPFAAAGARCGGIDNTAQDYEAFSIGDAKITYGDLQRAAWAMTVSTE